MVVHHQQTIFKNHVHTWSLKQPGEQPQYPIHLSNVLSQHSLKSLLLEAPSLRLASIFCTAGSFRTNLRPQQPLFSSRIRGLLNPPPSFAGYLRCQRRLIYLLASRSCHILQQQPFSRLDQTQPDFKNGVIEKTSMLSLPAFAETLQECCISILIVVIPLA